VPRACPEAKALATKEVCAWVKSGAIPSDALINRMSDTEIYEQLTHKSAAPDPGPWIC
jgi:hypothetical protein